MKRESSHRFMKIGRFGVSLMLLALMSCFLVPVNAQKLALNWKFKTKGAVLASPTLQNDKVYVGDQSGVFYCIGLSDGELIWKRDIGGTIQSKALLVEKMVVFESANLIYALNSASGQEIWHFDPKMEPKTFNYKGKKYHYKIDPFDDKRSGIVHHDGVLYFGGSNGVLYGLDHRTGKEVFSIHSDAHSPIRSTPFTKDDRLYYGDWDGKVYCYDLKNDEYAWKKKTYRYQKPYNTFGGVVSEFALNNGLLFFGARNYTYNVLLAENGEKEWTYTDQKGGWIIGDPVVRKDTLYVGGSDNFTMYAFDPEIGRIYWSQTRKKNIYTKPVVTSEWLAYTSGNGYDPNDVGELVLVKRSDGKFLDSFETTKGIFSSPAYQNGKLVFGCYDNNVYSLKLIKESEKEK